MPAPAESEIQYVSSVDKVRSQSRTDNPGIETLDNKFRIFTKNFHNLLI